MGSEKSGNKKLIMGCLGCLGFIALCFLILAGIGGYLFYLEESTDRHDPSNEVASVKVVPGKAFKLEFGGSEHGYAFHDYWLELADGAPANISGNFACTRYGKPKPRPFDTKHARTKTHKGKKIVRIHDGYDAQSPTVLCAGVIKPAKGLKVSRVFVSRSQRPSDWMAF